MNTQISPQTEQRFSDAVLLWLAALIGLSLLPVSAEAVQSLQGALVVGGPCAVVIWMVRYVAPGDLTPPSRIRTASYTILAAALATLSVLGFEQGIGSPAFSAGLPVSIGLGVALTVLTPLLGLWAVRVPVAVVIGALAALAAGLLIGDRDALALLCQFVFSGAAMGAAGASVMHRARELADDAPVISEESR